MGVTSYGLVVGVSWYLRFMQYKYSQYWPGTTVNKITFSSHPFQPPQVLPEACRTAVNNLVCMPKTH